jgi:DNA adenine methylase
VVKPLLKWAGGKRWLLPLLLSEIWPVVSQKTWVEPFVGGMAVPFGLNPKETLLNDINVHLINFYRQVKKGLKVNRVLKNDSVYYYEARDQFNQLIQERRHLSAQSATLFYYLIKTGFNGLCRFNQQGVFNVPFGQHKHIQYRTNFFDYRDIVAQWNFECQDFESLALMGDEVIYADPPYDVEFTQYYGNRFEWADQLRLADWLEAHKGPVIASNQATTRIVDLYQQLGFTVFTLPAPRRVSCTGDRRPALEILALKGMPKRVLSRVGKWQKVF